MDFKKWGLELLSAEELKSIEDMISVNSYLDFLDFIDFLEVEKLNKTIFMCTWMENNGKCIELGGYEENLQNKIVNFLTQKLHSAVSIDTGTEEEIFSDYDGEDNFRDYIRNLNAQLSVLDMQLILFFNDVYVQCSYFLFLVDRETAARITKEWDDSDLELVL